MLVTKPEMQQVSCFVGDRLTSTYCTHAGFSLKHFIRRYTNVYLYRSWVLQFVFVEWNQDMKSDVLVRAVKIKGNVKVY
jgi:hypothetical protein